MTVRELLVEAEGGEVRIASVVDGDVVDLIIERETGGTIVGDIFFGRVQRVVQGIGAAFVDIGIGRDGFLPLSDADRNPALNARPLVEGEKICVQIKRDAFAQKGPQLSRVISLPGRFLVYSPFGEQINVSRQIDDEVERQRLIELTEALAYEDEGFVVRTVAEGAGEGPLAAEADRLRTLWDDIVALQDSVSAPSVLYRDLGPLGRVVRDHAQDDVEAIWFDSAASLADARAFSEKFWPDLTARLHLFDGSEGLFDSHGVDEAIEIALQRRVALPSGGGIVVETTEALSVIDVNSGRYVEGTGPEENALRTNLEAADAIVCQVKLRNLGGVVLLDFIHMDEDAHWEQVLGRLKDGFRHDRISCRVLGRTAAGLVELVRRRRRAPLAETMLTMCGHCDGEGRVMNAESVAFDALRALIKSARNGPVGALTLSANPAVIEKLKDFAVDAGEGYAGIGRLVHHRPMPGYRMDRYDIVTADGYSGDSDGAVDD
jgi:ribonuclease G